MGLTDIKKELKKLDKDKLIDLIADLYKKEKAVKKAISEFKKFKSSPELVADLMLCYVEYGVKFTNDYGDIDEGFYSSLESTYDAALTLMKKERLLGKFIYRASGIVRNTDGIGWYFHDTLSVTYSKFYA